MKKETIIENKGTKYSEMIIDILNRYDSQLPQNLSFEEVIEIVIDAWNLANRKDVLESKKLYDKELKLFEYNNVIEQIVEYKQEKYNEYKNVIIEFIIDDERLQIKSQTQEEYFNTMFANIILSKPILDKNSLVKNKNKKLSTKK